MREVLPNIYCWEWYSDEKGYNFNGHFLVLEKDRIMVDPPPLKPDELEKIQQLGGPSCILITNRDHLREAPALRSSFSCPVWIHEKDAPLIDIQAERTFRGGDQLPGRLLAVSIPDNKSPGETAFLLERDKGVLILGDALIGNPPGQLNLMKAEKYTDVSRAQKGIGVLLGHEFHSVLLGDGVSVLSGAKQAVEDFMKRGL